MLSSGWRGFKNRFSIGWETEKCQILTASSRASPASESPVRAPGSLGQPQQVGQHSEQPGLWHLQTCTEISTLTFASHVTLAHIL